MTVYFIGSGPGDPELMTIKGQRLLDAAPVVLFAGSLIPDENMATARSRGALVIDTAALALDAQVELCLLYTSPSPRDTDLSRMPSSA